MRVIKISSENFSKVVEEAVGAVRRGEIIISPTDTVYGLLGDATSEKVARRVYKIKKRPKGKPIPIFVKDIKMAERLAEIRKDQEEFLEAVWPGKVTVVLRRKNSLPKVLFGKAETIGLRIPNYKLVNFLLKRLDLPLVGTSANISGKPAPTEIKEVLKQFESRRFKPGLVLDAGDLKPAKPSVVIDLTGEKTKILRK